MDRKLKTKIPLAPLELSLVKKRHAVLRKYAANGDVGAFWQ